MPKGVEGVSLGETLYHRTMNIDEQIKLKTALGFAQKATDMMREILTPPPPPVVPPPPPRTVRKLDGGARREPKVDPPGRTRPRNTVGQGKWMELNLFGESAAWPLCPEEGEWECEIDEEYNLAIIAARHNGQALVRVSNSFPNVGPIELHATELRDGGKVVSSYPALTLNPGECIYLVGDHPLDDTENDFNGTLDAYHSSHWRTVAGRLAAGTGDANEGGGMLIYPGIAWAHMGDRGRALAQKIQIAYAHMTPWSRLDREAFQRGEIKPCGILGGVINDRTSTYGTTGYIGEYPNRLPWLGGTHKSTDDQHLGRFGHAVAARADQGDPIAEVQLDEIAWHVADSWTFDGGAAAKGVQNFFHWGIPDLLAKWPKGKPCFFLGREFGHALNAVARACKHNKAHMPTLLKLIEGAKHCWSEELGTFYAVPPVDPVFGLPSPPYEGKMLEARGLTKDEVSKLSPQELRIAITTSAAENKGFANQIPHGVTPTLAKTFEFAINGFGMRAALQVVEDLELEHMLERTMQVCREHPEQVWVIGHPEMASTKKAHWWPLILGDVSMGDLLKLAKTENPLIGSAASHPLAMHLVEGGVR